MGMNDSGKWTGKAIGALIGMVLTRRVQGGVLGLIIGHAIDQGWFRYLFDQAQNTSEQPQGSEHEQQNQRRSTPPPVNNPYHVLGVSQHAPMTDVDKAYRRLMAKFHPDRVIQASEAVKAEAEERARAINTAYDKIKQQRAKHA